MPRGTVRGRRGKVAYMFEIEGRYATAKCFATVVEDSAVEQVRAMCDTEFTDGCQVRIMPDVHAGAGCTIGTTMTVTDKVVPNVVGVDIGCGMYVVNLGRVDIDMAAFDAACHKVPSGPRVWEGRREHFNLLELESYRELRDTKRIERSIGTLGGGNHFIEIDEAADGTRYLVIHSGSRNLGKQVAEFYQGLAVDLHKGREEYFRQRDALIAEYKGAGRRKEIQAALKKLNKAQEQRPLDVPADLCWLYGTYFDAYMADIEVCQAFARLNREVMAREILQMTGLHGGESFHTVHNYIDTSRKILRKGAIAAYEGEVVLIPINMRDGSILARGKGNPDWNFSAPHGAGRLMSRGIAREHLDMGEYRRTMAGVYTTSVSESTIDEAPMAYKSLADILGPVSEAVDVIEVLKPIYNFKAS